MAENEEKKVTETAEKPVEKKPAAKKAATKKAPAKKAAAKKAPAKKAPAKKEAPAKEEAKAEAKPAEVKAEVKEEGPKRDSATAHLSNLGVTPRKARLVVDLVRGKDVEDAYAILDNCDKMCAPAIKKLIASAASNAVNNFGMSEEGLYVAKIYVDDAMRLKRILPRAKGSASGLIKRWCHVTVTVKNREAK